MRLTILKDVENLIHLSSPKMQDKFITCHTLEVYRVEVDELSEQAYQTDDPSPSRVIVDIGIPPIYVLSQGKLT